MNAAQKADRILTHYITQALMAAGVTVNGDVYAELDGIIERAVKEAVQEAVKEAVAQAVRAIPPSVLE